MEFAEILSTLRRRKLATILVILLAVGAAVEAKRMAPAIPGGQATAQILVDSSAPAVASTHTNEAPLATRAAIIAQVMGSDALLERISQVAGIPRSQITSEGPYNAPALGLNAVTPSEARGPQLLSNFKLYRLTFLPQPGLPIVTVLAQGTNPPEAARLVGAVVLATQQYLTTLAQGGGTAAPGVTVRQLGPAQESAYSPGGSKALMAVTGLGAFVIGLLLLVVADALRRRGSPTGSGHAWLPSADAGSTGG